MVEFVECLDAEKVKSLANFQMKKNLWLSLCASALFIGIGVLGVALELGDYTFGIFSIVLGVLLCPVLLLATKLGIKSNAKSMSVVSAQTQEVYRFYDEGIVITTKKGDEYEGYTKARYSYLYKVEETADKYFMQISNVQYYILSKKNITQGTAEELNKILAVALNDKFKPYSKK